MKKTASTESATFHTPCTKAQRLPRRRILAGAMAAFLGLAGGAQAVVQDWDVNGATAGFGGTGDWNLTTPNWNDATGTGVPSLWLNKADTDAVFQGTPGVVTLTVAGVQARNLTFNVGGYTVAGSVAAPLNLTSNAVVTVTNAADTATISAPLVTTTGFDKQGPGTLVLSGANTYSGQTSVSAGTLKAGSVTAFSATSNYFVSGTLDLGGFSNPVGGLAGLASAFVTNNGPAAAVLTLGANNLDATFQGVIQDGPGGVSALGITKTGTAAQTFTGANTYTGDTLLQSGSLFADVSPGGATNKAFGTGVLVTSDATRIGSTVDNEVIANNIKLQGDLTIEAHSHLKLPGTVDMDGGVRGLNGSTTNAEINFTGEIKNGGLTFNSPVNYTSYIIGKGDGTDVANTYTGLTTVNNNSYLVLNKDLPGAAIDGAILGDVVQNGTGSLDYFKPDQISDTSSVTVNGPGNFLGADNYAGMQLNNHDETIGSLFGASTEKIARPVDGHR